MMMLLRAKLQISLHVAQHQDHLDRKTHLFCEVHPVHHSQNVPHLRPQQKHQRCTRQTSQALSDLVQKMGLKVHPVAEIGNDEQRNHHQERSPVLDCFVRHEEAHYRDEEYGSVQFGRIFLHELIFINMLPSASRQTHLHHSLQTCAKIVKQFINKPNVQQLLELQLGIPCIDVSGWILGYLCIMQFLWIQLVFVIAMKSGTNYYKPLPSKLPISYHQHCFQTEKHQHRAMLQPSIIKQCLCPKQDEFNLPTKDTSQPKSFQNQAECRDIEAALWGAVERKRKRSMGIRRRPINFELQVGLIQQLGKRMEKIFRIKPKLSLTPGKPIEGIYRVRLAKRTARPKNGEIWQTLEGARGASLSPRKGKPSMLGLFRGARQIEPSETYLLHEKTQRQSKTKESSSPQVSEGFEEGRLLKPMGMARNNRSMSGGKLQARRGKAIQRTVSIVIEGAQATEQNQRELMDTLSRIILGEESKNEFLIEFIGESSIHGEELNFVDLDSRLLTQEVTPDESSFLI